MIEAMTAGALAGLLSAPHCAVMCGPLALGATRGRSWQASANYHIGRGLAYLVAGAVVGWAGKSVFSLVWNQHSSMALSFALAAVMLFAAYRSWPKKGKTKQNSELISLRPKKDGPAKLPWAARILRKLPKRPEMIGAISALLPCAALWSGFVLAASSASPIGGALTMLSFSLTSAGGLLASQFLAQKFAGGKHAGRALTVLFVLSAALLIWRPFSMDTSNLDAPNEDAAPHCPLHAGMEL